MNSNLNPSSGPMDHAAIVRARNRLAQQRRRLLMKQVCDVEFTARTPVDRVAVLRALARAPANADLLEVAREAIARAESVKQQILNSK